MSEQEHCGVCRFFERGFVDENGRCRRGHPAALSLDAFGGAYGVWPRVDAKLDWCGEFLPIRPTPAPGARGGGDGA